MTYIRAFLFVCLLIATQTSFAIDAASGIQVTPLLKTTQTWDGAPLAYPSGEAQVTALVIEIAPGKKTGWHEHPVPSFAYMLAGTLEVTLKDGKVKRLQAGDPLAEVINTAHNGHNVGETPVKIVVFYTGVVGKPLTIAVPTPQH